MTSEEEQNNVSLKEFVLQKFTDNDKYDSLFAATVEKRLDALNDVKGALRELSVKNVSRQEFDIQIEKILESIKLLMAAKDRAEGKASQMSVIFAIIIAVASLLVGVIGLFHSFAGAP